MRDIIGQEASKIFLIKQKSREIFQSFNYVEIKLPSVEEVSLFLRTIGESTDIVEKQMYIFKDKGERTVALRPEGTAGVVRSCIQNNLFATYPVTKLFYSGSMFRYERPQEGRYREFYQIGCEYFGNGSAVSDAEIIILADKILGECGVKSRKININSIGCRECRPTYSQKIKEYSVRIKDTLCEDCQRRIDKNPLRVLDCRTDKKKLEDFPAAYEHLCRNCENHFYELKSILNEQKIDFAVEPKIVRGLDYYTGTVFEIKSDVLGAQDTIAAGGRYDCLVEEMGGKATPACGFAIGVERLILASENIPIKNSKKFFVAIQSDDFKNKALSLALKLRENRFVTEGPIPARSLKSQLNSANKMAFDFSIIFAEEEFKKNEVILKNMADGSQKTVKIENVVDEILSIPGERL